MIAGFETGAGIAIGLSRPRQPAGHNQTVVSGSFTAAQLSPHFLRPFVVGRRNWLFADTVAGANASANLYSLLQTCLVNGIDGYRYLAALFKRLPLAQSGDDYESLLPWRLTTH